MDSFLIAVLSNIGMISFLGLSAYVLLLTGGISFGQQAFFGIGAYAAGIATAIWGWPLWMGLAHGAAVGALACAALGAATLRLGGLHFAVATLAFAEMMRLLLGMWRWQVDIAGRLVGPAGTDGFRDIRYIFANGISEMQYFILIWLLLAAAVVLLMLFERTRTGMVWRMIGKDAELARMLGVDVVRHRIAAAALAGALAGVGGALYAHLSTYIEPGMFDPMLGIHGLAYGIIGGLGTPLGPLLGVVVDIGILESSRLFSGYRMIVFGGLVAVILVWRPRGLLDEAFVRRLRGWRPFRSTLEEKGR